MPGRTGSKVILSVDDNSGDSLLLKEAFQRTSGSLELQFASDGTAVLAKLKSAERLPDLILLDLKLPKTSGLDVLRQLKDDERTRCIPVVVLSSSQAPGDIVAAYQLHCNAYLRKPSDFAQLVQLVKLLSEFWLEVVLQP